MFLFTTPQTRETQPANPVVSAIRDGAAKTGAGFDFVNGDAIVRMVARPGRVYQLDAGATKAEGSEKT